MALLTELFPLPSSPFQRVRDACKHRALSSPKSGTALQFKRRIRESSTKRQYPNRLNPGSSSHISRIDKVSGGGSWETRRAYRGHSRGAFSAPTPHYMVMENPCNPRNPWSKFFAACEQSPLLQCREDCAAHSRVNSEIRRSKAGGRKPEGRRPKVETNPNRPRPRVSVFGFRNSAFFRPSDFGLRTSAFGLQIDPRTDCMNLAASPHESC